MRRGILLLPGFILPGLILAGCAPPVPRDIAVFALAPAQPAQNLPVAMLLAPIGAAPAYMGKDMLYRLGYTDNQLHPYGSSRWNAPPINMLASVMHQTAGGNLLALDQSNQLARCSLRIELTAFEQVFTDAQNSHAELGMHYSLMQLRNQRILGNGKLRLDIPAQTADAQGGAMALEKASHQAASQIMEWLNHLLAPTVSGANPARAACER
ncbi:MAG: membrane integrity-associated transporter subunit PqiC [Nitrosomonadales bacterium]|nr:membrane integrity-associated transporter subunit PqiC [Nitrosomonadales bacterium]